MQILHPLSLLIVTVSGVMDTNGPALSIVDPDLRSQFTDPVSLAWLQYMEYQTDNELLRPDMDIVDFGADWFTPNQVSVLTALSRLPFTVFHRAIVAPTMSYMHNLYREVGYDEYAADIAETSPELRESVRTLYNSLRLIVNHITTSGTD